MLLAGVELRPGGEERERGAADLHLLRSRHTDRQRFTSWPISPERLRRLARAAQRPEVQAVPVVGAGRKTQLDALVQESARALTVAATGLAVDLPERDPGGQIESDDGVLVLTGGADDVATWLSVGEALSDLWLEATRQGLAVVPLCAPIESPATRALVGRTLPPEAGVPHLVLRISWGALGHSHLADPARRSVDDVLRATWDEGPARSMPTASHHRAPGRPE